MIFCKTLNKQFNDKKAMFLELKERKEELFALKKATIKTTDECAHSIKGETVIKSDDGTQRALQIGDTVICVINTTNYLDSHDDVHLSGIWDKSAAEQTGKTFHVSDHDLKIGSVVAYPKDVSIEVKQMQWRELGVDADGMTDALLFHTKMTDKTNSDVFKVYRDKDPVQHSIRMQYVKIALAVNDPEMKEEYALYQAVLPKILNKDKAEEMGYFFAVSEAKIYKEGSTVLFGSNDITPSLGFKQTTQPQPPKSTAKEPDYDFMAMCKNFKL